jgi:hypothetical protein
MLSIDEATSESNMHNQQLLASGEKWKLNLTYCLK